jgi:hypothetical protein
LFQVPFFRTNFWRATGVAAALGAVGIGAAGWLWIRQRKSP